MDVFSLPYPAIAIADFVYNEVQYSLGNVVSVASLGDLDSLVEMRKVLPIYDLGKPVAVVAGLRLPVPGMPGALDLRQLVETGITTQGISDEQQNLIWDCLRLFGAYRRRFAVRRRGALPQPDVGS
jgi:hypothetical protein